MSGWKKYMEKRNLTSKFPHFKFKFKCNCLCLCIWFFLMFFFFVCIFLCEKNRDAAKIEDVSEFFALDFASTLFFLSLISLSFFLYWFFSATAKTLSFNNFIPMHRKMWNNFYFALERESIKMSMWVCKNIGGVFFWKKKFRLGIGHNSFPCINLWMIKWYLVATNSTNENMYIIV